MCDDGDIGTERIGQNEERLAFGTGDLFINNDHSSGGLETGLVVFFEVDKRNVSGGDFVDLVDTCGGLIFISDQFGSGKFCEPAHGNGLGKLHSLKFR